MKAIHMVHYMGTTVLLGLWYLGMFTAHDDGTFEL
jgi:hypothetical protein